MKLLVHIEQYDVVGILPSQLESLALHNTARGVTDAVYVDKTRDGFRGVGGFRKVDSLKDFLASEKGPFFAFSPTKGEDIRTVKVPSDAWLIFGPSSYLQPAIVNIPAKAKDVSFTNFMI